METTMTATRIDRGSTDTTTIYSEGGDLVFERTFDAPRELVWKAMTEADRVPKWWGKKDSTTNVVEMDVRPGGAWRYISSAPGRDDVTFQYGTPGAASIPGCRAAHSDRKPGVGSQAATAPAPSRSTSTPFPFVQASESGVTPYRLAALTLAPARSSKSVISTSS